MSGFIEGEDRYQATLFSRSLDEYIAEDSAVRVIDVFIDDLDISHKFEGASLCFVQKVTALTSQVWRSR